MTDNNEEILERSRAKDSKKHENERYPRYPTPLVDTHQDIAHAAIRTLAIMAAILQAADSDRTYEECVTIARSLYTRTMRQMEEHGL